MMLRETFGQQEAAAAIETAIDETLRAGWRTADITEAGSRVVGTKEMGSLIARQLEDFFFGESAAPPPGYVPSKT